LKLDRGKIWPIEMTGNHTAADRWKNVIAWVVLWVVLAGMSLWFFRVWPKDVIAWLCVLTLGPIAFFVFLALEGLADEMIAAIPGFRRADRNIERRTASESFSVVRIVYYLVRSLAILVPILLLYWWLGDKVTLTHPGALKNWWMQHFS